MEDIVEILTYGVAQKASDLHLSAGLEPKLRKDGDLKPLNLPVLSEKEVHAMVYDIMPDYQKKIFEERLEVDFAFEIPNVSRFRVNAFKQQRGTAAVFRAIPSKIASLQDLGSPPIFAELMSRKNGIILVTGPTGSGKSTTLAAMIDYYNSNVYGHILTVEDPIEFVHTSKKSSINQREVGVMTHSFENSLHSALRADPDVILVGELRDLETIRMALRAAETGHLVLGTLHSSSAPKTINRIIDVFPEGEKGMIRTMLGESLQAVISQALVKKSGGGRVAAHEILVATDAIRNQIKENKIAQMVSSLQTGQASGMKTMDFCLRELVKKGTITLAEAKLHADRPDQFF